MREYGTIRVQEVPNKDADFVKQTLDRLVEGGAIERCDSGGEMWWRANPHWPYWQQSGEGLDR